MVTGTGPTDPEPPTATARHGESSIPPPPSTPTSFVGRVRECAEAAALLRDARMVTLTGSGGCGKTRLAAEVASDVAGRYSGRVCWVGLAGVRDPALVAPTVAAALGIRHPPGRGVAETLAEQLVGAPLLLVLDNCEHLLGACAGLVSSVLRRCPRVTVLATSREPLAVTGEFTFPVEPLPVPIARARTPREVREADAARLFELRVQQVRPGFSLGDDDAVVVAEICRHLDGIPLALELAAVRVRVLPLEQIAARLSDRFRLLTGGARDVPDRQRTLEASIDWSYELLDDEQQLALARLSAFAGSFALEAAQAVIGGTGIEEEEVLDLVASLADQSLLQVDNRDGQARYRLLETTRMYARGRLEELDDPARVQNRHLSFHVEVAERARAGLAGPQAHAWTTRLATDVDDLRAAMDRALASQRPTDVLDIAEPTARFWFDRGLYSEMRRRLRSSVEDPATSDSDRVRGSVTAALLGVSGADFSTAHAFADRAVSLLRADASDGSLPLALILRACAALGSGRGDDETIDADADEAVGRSQRFDDAATRAYVLIFAGQLAGRHASVSEAQHLLELALAVCEEGRVTFHLPAAHTYLASWSMFCGDLEVARGHARQGLELTRQLGRPGTEAVARASLAATDLFAGEREGAEEQLRKAQGLIRSSGLERTLFDLGVRWWVALAAYRFDELGTARDAADDLLRLSSEHTTHWVEMPAMWLLGVHALREGRLDRARGLLQRCRERSAGPRCPLALGRAALGLAHLAHAEDDDERAWELAYEGLEVLVDYQDRIGVADALETIAGLAALRGRADEALRLLAATEQFHATTGIGRLPLEADRYPGHVAAARSQLSDHDARACHTDGTGLALEEAVAYARRGRGERDRPRAGWEALTPTEQELVRLVAEGHTNAQIGEQLFISRNTVKKHLSHVYAKVGVDGRAELAAGAARHGL